MDVSLEIAVINDLERAKYLASQVRGKKDPSEKKKLYDEARGILRDILKKEPAFQGALKVLDKYTKESEQL